MTTQVPHLHSPARVLLVLDQPVLAEVIKLALNHGVYLTQVARTIADATAMLADWRPHLAVVDMDLGQGEMLDRLGSGAPPGDRLPVIAITRRGNLKTKLAAFERGVDDILTVPFPPEELVARILAVMRRAYGETVAFTPALRLGELEIDILSRSVRVGGMSCT